MGRWSRRLAFLVVVMFMAAGGFYAYVQSSYVTPSDLAIDRTVIIPKGAGVIRIAQILADDGLIRDPQIFKLGLKLEQLSGKQAGFLQAGEFQIPAKSSAAEVAQILRSGKTVVRKVTFAEGLTTQEILSQLRATEGLSGNVPIGVAEGALLPETYHFSYGDSRADIVQRMSDAMRATLKDLWPGRAQSLPIKTAYEAVILASIIEKETGLAEERARVAGVFVNRLNKGMRLQSDPTVVYGVTEGSGPLGRPISRKDLDTPTPYNTYTTRGLPPTPIANPGRAAIEAALNPMQHNEYYFVADGQGGHKFARTLKEHNRNVRDYRRSLR